MREIRAGTRAPIGCSSVATDTVGIERIDPGTFAFLQSLASGQPFALALEDAQAADATFDLAAVLSRHVDAGTFARVNLPVR